MAALGISVSGKIPVQHALSTGRSLARLTDLGWGNRLRERFSANSEDSPIDDGMLRACARVLGDWDWEGRLVAVVSIPSRSRPLLIDSLARGLAALGRLPHLGALELVGGGPTAGPGGNSAYRLASVWDRFAVSEQLRVALAEHPGPVLLIDDLADSKWTLTVAGGAMREAGVDAVLPFALAQR
jgi:ATP-dependent DNA helicase RecQ